MTYRYQAPCLAALILLAACGSKTPTGSGVHTEAPAESAVSIQGLMLDRIEPAAEALWESVSTTVSADGIEEKRPETDAEWTAVRAHAMTLMEAARLLKSAGRPLLTPGQPMADEGVQGVLAVEEIQAKIDTNRAQFNQFADLLHSVSEQMLRAIEGKNIQGMLDAGEAIDAACESCHLVFWYPNQVIPEIPDNAQ
jgi:cytochrome c556